MFTSISRSQFVLAAALAFALPVSAPASTLTPTGAGTPASNLQPSTVMTAVIRTTGLFSELGEIRWFAGNFAPSGFVEARGQSMSIASNSALFSLLGTAYGGDGRTTFSLPDLTGRAVMGATSRSDIGTERGSTTLDLGVAEMPSHTHDVNGITSTATGGGAATSNQQPTLSMRNEIFVQGVYPSRGGSSAGSKEMLALVRANAAVLDVAERYTDNAEGQILPISSNSALFSLLGTTYGGDGRTNFHLPDLRGRIAVGAGDGPGLTPRRLGQESGSDTITLSMGQLASHTHGVDPADQAAVGTDTSGPAGSSLPVSNVQPELALNYMIALTGIFPSRGGGSGPDFESEPMLGEIAMFAGNFAPSGWALAHGQLLSIASHDALFSILGTTFGGDGRTTFALPDLRGRTVIGSGSGYRLGQKLGGDSLVLTAANLPSHTHDFTIPPAPIPLPAGFLLLLSALVAPILVGRRRAT